MTIKASDILSKIEKLAKEGSAEHQYILGNILSTQNLCIEINMDLAIEYYTKSAKQKYRKALKKLKSMAVEGSYPSACKNAGLMYLEGNGVEKDPSEALRFFNFSEKYNKELSGIRDKLVEGILDKAKKGDIEALNFIKENASSKNIEFEFYLLDLSEKGDAEATLIVAKINLVSKYGNIRPEGLKYLKLASKQGSLIADKALEQYYTPRRGNPTIDMRLARREAESELLAAKKLKK